MIKKILIVLTTILASLQADATHNRAGEITYEQIGPLTIRMTVTTYTKTSSISADRDSILIFWGDGSSEFVDRSNGNGQNLGNDIKLNKYIQDHTYPGRATYTIGFADPNRVSNILNVNYPNSVEVEFFLATTLTLLDPQFQGSNSSAILLQPPVDRACANKVFIHNPNAFDPDGDSLSYELVVPRMSAEEEVPGYLFPDQVSAGPTNNVTLDPETGNFVWNTPKQQGEYNIAIKINEWRDGVLLNSIIRDMQILVVLCENDPPIIDVEDEICVVAGEEINLSVIVNDPNEGDLVGLSASGGPFEVDNPARLVNNPGFVEPEYTANFVWQTNCNHISDRYYQVVFRAVDNVFSDSTGLAHLRTVRIKVVGPPPQNLTAESESGGIRLLWDEPYDCEVTDDNFFQAFSVWRKVGSSVYPRDTCDPGLTGGPYEKVIFQTRSKSNGKFTVLDTNVEKGLTYCYRIVAEFAQISATGNPYNRIESLHSNEVCQQLSRDLPLLTKVSIDQTDESSGVVHIRWAKPLAQDLDTTVNPGPYTYELFRSLDDGLNFDIVNGFTVTTTTLSEIIDTNYFDAGVNTVDVQPHYYIRFSSNGTEYGLSSEASSTYLEVAPSDETHNLSWSSFVPWSKKGYNIFLQDPMTGDFDLLTSLEDDTYTHNNLDNETEYCYYIEAIGSYDIPNIEDPLINLSQVVCSTPIDNVPPCPPTLEVSNLCNDGNEIIDLEELINTLAYTQPNLSCPETDDVAGYFIYYSDIEGGELVRIGEVEDPEDNRYEHEPIRGIAGCYAVSAYDFNGNESELSNIVCVDNCPAYELPNTFTPNGDGANELFVPTINRFIASIDIQIFNEWGNKVFETNDPLIKWDGKASNGRDVAEGTYYYTCIIFEQRVTGNIQADSELSGYINVIR